MNAKDMILQSIDISDMIMSKYLTDLDDAAFMLRPIPGMNTIAWQVGHLISSERGTIEGIKPGALPPLPEGFDAMHGKETHDVDDPSRFLTKAQYLEIWTAQRSALKAALGSMTDEDLAAPAPEKLRSMAATVGHAINLLGGLHPLMHVGQFVAVRRAKQMPIVF